MLTSLLIVDLFILFISSCLIFGKSYGSRKSLITFIFSNLIEYIFLKVDPYDFQNFIYIYCKFSLFIFFISSIINLYVFLLLQCQSWLFLKRNISSFHWFFYNFHFYFINFWLIVSIFLGLLFWSLVCYKFSKALGCII